MVRGRSARKLNKHAAARKRERPGASECCFSRWPQPIRRLEEAIERLSMTLRQTANGKNETFAVCFQLSEQ